MKGEDNNERFKTRIVSLISLLTCDRHQSPQTSQSSNLSLDLPADLPANLRLAFIRWPNSSPKTFLYQHPLISILQAKCGCIRKIRETKWSFTRVIFASAFTGGNRITYTPRLKHSNIDTKLTRDRIVSDYRAGKHEKSYFKPPSIHLRIFEKEKKLSQP